MFSLYKKRKSHSLFKFGVLFIIALVFFVSNFISTVQAADVPTIIGYQGRLADADGNLLGGAGTNYHFKISFWTSPTIGLGTKVWPTGAPSDYSAMVRHGLFNINIGDTASGYPDALDYNFSENSNVYLQVEVSTDGSSFETVSPRQAVASAPFALVAGSVTGSGASTMGALQVNGNSTTTGSSYLGNLAGLANQYISQWSDLANFLPASFSSSSADLWASTKDFTSNVLGVLGINHGGTGTSTAPGVGQVLIGNASGGYDFVSASSLSSSILGSNNTWTGTNDFNVTTTFAGRVGIGTSTPGTYALSVAGDIAGSNNLTLVGDLTSDDISITSFIRHTADPNTTLQFLTDRYLFTAGGVRFVDFDASLASNAAYFGGNPGSGSDINWQWNTLAGNGSLFIDGGSGNIGVGTTTPYAKLVVQGTSTTPLLSINTSSTASALYVDANGYIGVGTTSPSVLFDVSGAIKGTSLTADSGGVDSNSYIYLNGRRSGAIRQASIYASWTGGIVMTPNSLNPTFTVYNNAVANASNLAGLVFNMNTVNGWNTYASINAQSIDVSTTTPSGILKFQTENAGTMYERMRIDNLGNVGIGTTTPSAKLSIHDLSGLAGTNPLFTIASSTSAGLSTTTLLTVLGNGNVGIGSAVPGSKLEVVSSDSVMSPTSGSGLLYLNNTYSGTESSNLMFGTNNLRRAVLSAGKDGVGTTGGYFAITTRQDSDALFYERFRIDNAGNVGIGTTSPISTLSVSGTAGTNPFTISSSTGGSMFTILQNGNVGIGGMVAPIYTVDITGSLRISNNIIVSGTNYSGAIVDNNNGRWSLSNNLFTMGRDTYFAWGPNTAYGSPDISLSRYATGTFAIGTGAQGSYAGTLIAGSIGLGTTTNFSTLTVQATSGVSALNVVSSTGLSMLTVASNGNVGIGVTNPSAALDVGANSVNAGSYKLGQITALTTASSNTLLRAGAGLGIAFGINGAGTLAASSMYLSSTGLLGLGSTTPSAKLSIHDLSGLAGTNPLFTIASSTSAGLSTTTLLTVLGNGNMGIGKSNPLYTLDINGAGGTNTATIISVKNLDNGAGHPGAQMSLVSSGWGEWGFSVGDPTVSTNRIFYGAGGFTSFKSINLGIDFLSSSGGSSMRILNGGNVGIGTTSPISTLSVSGTAGTNPFAISSSTGGSMFTILQNGNVGIGTAAPVQMLDVAGSIQNRTGSVYTNSIRTYNTGRMNIGGSEGVNILSNDIVRISVLKDSGFVGIGTSTPQATLMVQASSSTMALNVVSSTGLSMLSVAANGYVGIGTTTPMANLEVVGSTGIKLSYGSSSSFIMMNSPTDNNVAIRTGNNSDYGTLLAKQLITYGPVYGYSFSSVNQNMTVQATIYYDQNAGDLYLRGANAYSGATVNVNGRDVFVNGGTPVGAGRYGNIIMNNSGLGYVGIGTTTPLSTLVVQATSGVSALNVVSKAGASMLSVAANGYVGIGTSTPFSKFAVVGVSTSPIAYFADDNSSNLKIEKMATGLALEGHTNVLGPAVSAVAVRDGLAIVNSSADSVYEAFGATSTIGLSFSSVDIVTSSDITFEDQIGLLTLRSNGIELNSTIGVKVTDLGVNGAVYSNNGILTNVNPSSDSYKNSIAETNLNTEALLGLQVKSYNWNNNGQADFGLIAEDVKSALPELYLESNGTKGYRSDHLPFYLLQIAQKQNQELKVLAQQISNYNSSTSLVVADSSSNNFSTLAVQSSANFYGTITVRGEAGFESKVTFNQDIEVKGKIYTSADQAGTATITINGTSTEVVFTQEYEVVPKVTAQAQVNPNAFTWISDKTTKGFRINIAGTATTDVPFDWIVLAVKPDPNATSTTPVTETPVAETPAPEVVVEQPSVPNPTVLGEYEASSTPEVIPEPVTPPPAEVVPEPVVPEVAPVVEVVPVVVGADSGSSPE